MIKQATLDFSENKGKETIYEKVKAIMMRLPSTRDSYARLDGEFYGATSSFYGVMKMIEDGQLPSIESVHRARRMVEEDFPHLRGQTYAKRHNKSVEVSQTIHFTPTDTIESL
jgi:hypothetical protein